jgi:hypothetical protein
MSAKVKHPTLKEKVAVYEDLLHTIQLHAAVTMDNAKVMECINRICTWSYAHRQGNGELSDQQQQQLIDRAFWRFDIHGKHKDVLVKE